MSGSLSALTFSNICFWEFLLLHFNNKRCLALRIFILLLFGAKLFFVAFWLPITYAPSEFKCALHTHTVCSMCVMMVCRRILAKVPDFAFLRNSDLSLYPRKRSHTYRNATAWARMCVLANIFRSLTFSFCRAAHGLEENSSIVHLFDYLISKEKVNAGKGCLNWSRKNTFFYAAYRLKVVDALWIGGVLKWNSENVICAEINT